VTKPIENTQDAMLWMAYMARYVPDRCLRKNMQGMMVVLAELINERDEAKARAADLASKLERLEAKTARVADGGQG